MLLANRLESLQSVRLAVPGGFVYADLRKSSAHPLVHSQTELTEQDVMRRFVKPGTVAFDIGAHWGYHSVFMTSLGAKVFAFEPCPSVLPSLRKTVAETNITLSELALSDRSGEIEFFIPADESAASMKDWVGTSTAARCRMERLDDLNLPSPSFVKCDVEGAEALVFRGAAKTIAAHKPTILFEINPRAMKSFGLEPDASMNVLRELGSYSFERIGTLECFNMLAIP